MNKINLAMVGLGYWGPNILRSFNKIENVNVKYICDLDEKKLNSFKDMYPQTLLTLKFQDIIEDKEVDAVVIATSAGSHYKLAKQALEAGKHVFVEKPITLDVKEAEELVKISKESNKKLMVGHLLLYHPAVDFLKNYIDSGELGDIRYIYTTRVNLGKVRNEENAFWSLAPHDISVILYLLGQEPKKIWAKGESYLRDGVEDVVFSYLEFENKVAAHIHASWLDPHKTRKITVVGTKKMAVFDDMQPVEKVCIYDKSVQQRDDFNYYDEEYLYIQNGDIVTPQLSNIEPLYAECSHFIDCIVNDKKPRSDGENGVAVLKVLAGVEELLKKG
jgi:predicted dehydrogenase